ncbi:unnamed protein product, partial [Vitis vinifera]
MKLVNLFNFFNKNIVFGIIPKLLSSRGAACTLMRKVETCLYLHQAKTQRFLYINPLVSLMRHKPKYTTPDIYTPIVSSKLPSMSDLRILFIFFLCFISSIHAATFQITNQCSYTVWAAASPGGGRRLDRGQSWTLNVPAGTKMARIWGRTNCHFDASGRGRCDTGDCGGVLNCQGWGSPPNTLAEYALNQFGNKDFFDISLVDGFNIPMDFSPTSRGCRGIKCPDAYSYPQDDPTSTFTCPGGTNYRVVFCPRGSSNNIFPLEMYGSDSEE